MSESPARPVVFLDRDGTIMKDKHYLSDPDGVELLPGAAEGRKRLMGLGAALVVVSNQSGVGRGYFTDEDVERINARLRELLASEGVALDGFFHCPHAPEHGCDCRKPKTALVARACEALGLDSEQAPWFVIGDKDADVQLGHNLGAKSVLVLTGKGRAHRFLCKPDFQAENLDQAAEWIAEQLA